MFQEVAMMAALVTDDLSTVATVVATVDDREVLLTK